MKPSNIKIPILSQTHGVFYIQSSMARLRVLNHHVLFQHDVGTASFKSRNSSGEIAMLLFLLATLLIAVLQRGRGRGHGRGRSGCHGRVMAEDSDQFTDIETGQSDDRIIVNQHDDLSEENNRTHGDGMNDSSVARKAARKPRSHSTGEYGKPPPPDKRRAIPLGHGHIMDPKATRTVTSIIRQHWPVGCFTYEEAVSRTRGEFEKIVLKEYRTYYKYEDGICEKQGNAEVVTHVKNRMNGLKSEEKRRALREAAMNGKSIYDQQPTYFSTEVWNSLCSHFLSKEHTDKSETNKKNRAKKIITHASGATSHAQIKMDLTRKRQRNPSRLELFDSTYISKGTQSYTSQEAKEIAERYKKILEERLHTLGEQEEEPLEWWIEATGPVKKNRILGEPRIPASDLLSGSYHDKHTTNESSSGPRVSDDLFFKVMKDTLQAASSSTLFNKTYVSREQVETLAEDVVGENTSNSEDGIDTEKKEEMTRLVIITLEDIFSKVHLSMKEKECGVKKVNASSSFNQDEEE